MTLNDHFLRGGMSFPEVVKIVICHFVIFEKKRGCQTSIYLYIIIYKYIGVISHFQKFKMTK